MERIVGDLMKSYQGDIHPLSLFSPVSDGNRLDAFTEDGLAYIAKRGTNYKNFRFEPLSATLFMHFKRTGNRTDYEDVFFGKRRALNALVMAEYAESKGQYLDDIINGIFSLCEESTWVLPPHNSYVRDATQLLLPDPDRPVLDLFACETGALLATVYRLLKPSLDEVSPLICRRITFELQRRIITPYLAEHFWWMGKEDEPMCNWTIWCTQNILLTASQIPLDADVYRRIVEKAADSTDYFLKDYGADGCCDEGAQYYRHSGLCLYFTLTILNDICEDTFVSLWDNEKIRNIAEYICNVHVEGPYYINFADCSPIAGRAGVREYLFGRAIGSTPLCSFAALDYIAGDDPYIPDEINLSYHLLNYMHEGEIRNYAATHPTQIPAQNVWYESVGIFIARTGDSCLAVKAGDNDDSHNHNDTGSVILYHKGQPVLVDIGVESYTLKTFSPQRYEIWTMQSGYHNLPTLNGYDQLPGSDYHASDVQTSLSTGISSISMELSSAYPKECGVSSYLRHAALIPAGTDETQLTDWMRAVLTQNNCPVNGVISRDSILLEDTFSTCPGNEVLLNFITYEKPVFKDNILSIGDLYRFATSPVAKCEIEELPITDARLQICWKHSLYRIRFTSINGHFSMCSF